MLKTEKVARRFVFATFFLYLCITINKLNFRKYAPHALKGQKLLAQGNALGVMAGNKAPCKGKSLINCLEF